MGAALCESAALIRGNSRKLTQMGAALCESAALIRGNSRNSRTF
jgi:hypothetical protein